MFNNAWSTFLEVFKCYPQANELGGREKKEDV